MSCDCNAPIVMTGTISEKLHDKSDLVVQIVDGACCSNCLKNICIPRMTVAEFYVAFGKYSEF